MLASKEPGDAGSTGTSRRTKYGTARLNTVTDADAGWFMPFSVDWPPCSMSRSGCVADWPVGDRRTDRQTARRSQMTKIDFANGDVQNYTTTGTE